MCTYLGWFVTSSFQAVSKKVKFENNKMNKKKKKKTEKVSDNGTNESNVFSAIPSFLD